MEKTDLKKILSISGEHGLYAYLAQGRSGIIAESLLTDSGTRYDYCESPEYIYFDGRGAWTVRPKACGSGAGVCRMA